MPLLREARKEDSLEPVTQDLPPGYDPEVAPSVMTEDNESAQGIESRSDTPDPSTGYRVHHLGRIHQTSHSNSVQNSTEVNIDAAIMDSPSEEEHNVPSH